MNRTKKLRGGDDLTKLEQGQLRSLSFLGLIAYRINIKLDSLRSKLLNYRTTYTLDADGVMDATSLVNSEYDNYVDSFVNKKDTPQAIDKAKDMKPLEKHYNNVKGLAEGILALIQKRKNNAKKANTPPPPPGVPISLLPPPPGPGPKPEVPGLEPESVAAPGLEPEAVAGLEPEPAVEPVPAPANESSKLVLNLLAEIDILKSELVSKDISLEEKNREIVSAFSLLANREKTKIENENNPDKLKKIKELERLKEENDKKREETERLKKELDEENKKLFEENNSLKEEVEKLEDEKEESDEKNAKLQKKIDSDEEQIKIIEGLVKLEQTQINSLELDLKKKDSEITRKNQENELKDTILNGLRTNLSEKNKENETITSQLQEKDIEIARLIAELETLKASSKSGTNEKDKTVSEQAAKIAGLTAQLGELTEQLNGEKEKNRVLVETEQNNKAEIERLKQQNLKEEASKKILNLELEELKRLKNVSDEKNKELEDLLKARSEVNALTKKNEGLFSQEIDKLKGENATLKASTVELQTQLQELTANKNQLTESNVDLQRRVEQLIAVTEKLPYEIIELTDKNKTLQGQIDKLSAQLPKQLDETPEKLKIEIERLNEQLASLKGEHEKNKRINAYPEKTIKTWMINADLMQQLRQYASNFSTVSGGTPNTRSTSGSVDPTGREFKKIDPETIMRHTLFKDLELLIINSEKKDIRNIISSLNDIIESCNKLYKTEFKPLPENSKIKDINEMILKLSKIIKPK